MGGSNQCAGVGAAYDLFHTALDLLERLPVTPRRQSIATLTICLIRLRVPVSRADALDQSESNSISLDRQRVIGVGLIDLVDETKVSLTIRRESWRRRENSQHRPAQGLPYAV